ncbi:MAG: hypothetical protein RE471_08205 [Ferroplasma sp.]|uniref:hypothetical protein n=1 Tax=Ferroplasma sp. TaxID=2591003 RepID=UPI002814E7FE|nr:hypothetical protein [Ferroplasma sp.]WMT50949.1 MAG: hypothetical protein RE471_08205 [Ferroplasma sp.]
MKNLINSIKLISINYMFSTNNTMHKFGIEYSYIATGMSNMLKSTDNNVKNKEINQTVGIAIDWNWMCTVSLVGLVAGVLMLLLSGVGLVFDTMLVFWIYNGLFIAASGSSIIGTLWGCF